MEGGAGLWVVYGTRPEVVKLWPVVRALEARPEPLPVRRVFTGQHAELGRDLFDALDMAPDVDLDLMRRDQAPGELGARCLEAAGRLLASSPPEMVLVQGDTASVFFTALAAFLRRVPVAHVEAGLRTHRRDAPFPEEMMRRLTAPVADLHFPPTPLAAENLRAEGVDPARVHVTGNPSVDAVRRAAPLARRRADPEVRRMASELTPYLVVTLHRRESFGGPFRRVLGALGEFAAARPDVHLVWPVHPNPRVREQVAAAGLDRENVHLLEPLGYLEMVCLLQGCDGVFTDSGGLQEEGPALGKSVVVAREETERPEGTGEGWLRLAGTDPGAIRAALEELLRTPDGSPSVPLEAPHGDGRAGERVADLLLHRLRDAARRTEDWVPRAAAPLGGAPGRGVRPAADAPAS